MAASATTVAASRGEALPWYFIYREHERRFGAYNAQDLLCRASVKMRRLIKATVSDASVKRELLDLLKKMWSAQLDVEHAVIHATAATVGDYERFLAASKAPRRH